MNILSSEFQVGAPFLVWGYCTCLFNIAARAAESHSGLLLWTQLTDASSLPHLDPPLCALSQWLSEMWMPGSKCFWQVRAQNLPTGQTKTSSELCCNPCWDCSSVCPPLAHCQTSIMVPLQTAVLSHLPFTVISLNECLVCFIFLLGICFLKNPNFIKENLKFLSY